jgi:putative MATE family efflux protein
MRDLTQGSIPRHIVTMAGPIFCSTITFMLWLLVDIYFVAGIGDAAVAGVGSAGSVTFLVSALVLVLSAGTLSLIARAAGRKDQPAAGLVLNQSLGLAVLCGTLTLVCGLVFARNYMRSVAADESVVEAGSTYLRWYSPAMALQFAAAVLASALRATGVVRPTVIIEMSALVLNIVLAPLLIGGWGGHQGFGVAGAGLASSLAAIANLALLGTYLLVRGSYARPAWRQCFPQIEQWKQILLIGLPAAAELTCTFVYVTVIYYALSKFGAAAQASFGIGSRILGALQSPAMAIALATGAIAGQNFGAGNGERVRETFKSAATISTALMVAITIFVEWKPTLLLSGFTDDPLTIDLGTNFLQLISLNLVAQGLIFVSSAMFQGLGNTMPVLVSSGVRLVLYALPILWLSAYPYFRVEHIWYLSNATTALQAILCLALLRFEFRKRLPPLHQAALNRLQV